MQDFRKAISPTRQENFPEWYQSVVRDGNLAEMAHVRGCMVIKPWGYGIWENIQSVLGKMIKKTGAENAYFPLLIPMSYMQKEADHVEGFAKEIAVVTHHKLENHNGQLIPAGKLNEPVVIRPTSETIIGESFAAWIKSYRDLPIKINQWCNVLRWERRPRIFLRTSEFLWQEGHTAFATEEEAINDALEMIKVYRTFAQNWLGIPVIVGTKPAFDRFPGAIETYTIEAMMQDGKALQAGTSHYLGQNFSRSANICFVDQDGEQKNAYTASWGCSTRLIGALIMTHADDNGLRIPPKISPVHIAIIPILRNNSEDSQVLEYAREISSFISERNFLDGSPIIGKIDLKNQSAVEKKWDWVKRGVPIQVEIGSRDIRDKKLTVRLRSENTQNKHEMPLNEFIERIPELLDSIQEIYFNQANSYKENSVKYLQSFNDLEEFFSSGQMGFVLAPWHPSVNNGVPRRLEELGVTIRCIPIDQSGESCRCVFTGKKTHIKAIFGRAY
ncbi:MAG: Proline--tRNA ligase [Syntrophus sp. SKADARSKE-3]|nr:Proline--tRNA ligase [Syntrophus sp. SKADARSKE-3]